MIDRVCTECTRRSQDNMQEHSTNTRCTCSSDETVSSALWTPHYSELPICQSRDTVNVVLFVFQNRDRVRDVKL